MSPPGFTDERVYVRRSEHADWRVPVRVALWNLCALSRTAFPLRVSCGLSTSPSSAHRNIWQPFCIVVYCKI